MYTNINIISSWPARCWPCLFTLLRESLVAITLSRPRPTQPPDGRAYSIITVTTYLVEMHSSWTRIHVGW